MNKLNGDDLLNTFTDLNVDLRSLNPNVIKAWFDTDCQETEDLLNWLCVSLSSANYVSPLEKAEFDDIEEQLSSEECLKELAKVNPNYLSLFDNQRNLEDLLLIQNEVDLLEDENKGLDKLINIYENLDSNMSSELAHKTHKEIEAKVACKKSQETCENLSKNLDEFNRKLQKMLVKYNPDSHIVNFIDVNDYQEDFEQITSFLETHMEIDQMLLENPDEQSSSELETCRKRILHSYQIYLANKVETEKLKEVSEFLDKTDINESMLGWDSLNSKASLPVKELYKKRMCGMLDNVASRFADRHLKHSKIRYAKHEYEELQQKYRNVSKISENITKYLSYYAVLNCLQFEEKKDVKCINDFYQKMFTYINDDLYKCRARTEQMKMVIEDYNSYQTKPIFEKSKLISSIAKILSSDDYTLKSAAKSVCKFKIELNHLESNIFSTDFNNEKEVTRDIHENIKLLQKFLISGPTNRVVLIPLDLQEVWFEIEENLKKGNASITQALKIPHNVRKSLTNAQNYTRRLWMHFLTNPSKLDSVLKQAEEDFKKRTQQYF